MRSYVRVLVPTTTDDGEGGQSVRWDEGEELWADIRPLSAREQALAGALQSIVTLVAVTHYTTCVTTQRRLQRIDPEGPDLQILGVRDPDGRRRIVEMDCAEVV